jgi:hypothetical protein
MSDAMSPLRRRSIAALLATLTATTVLLAPRADAQSDGCVMWGSICVPPEGKAVIDSVQRTPATNNHRIMEALGELEAMGVPRDEVLRNGLGRFPIGGKTNYVHDWLYPRFGPGFRFHQGTDMFADHGTPIRSPVDGVATSSNNSLGGLTVRVTMPDGTYFYLAHLSDLAPGFQSGMQVAVGDVVGYVGNSGNARTTPPHLHIGIYPQGGPAVDPKPILDRFLAEAEARLPEVIEAYRQAYGVSGPPVTAPPPPPEAPPSPPAPQPGPAPQPEATPAPEEMVEEVAVQAKTDQPPAEVAAAEKKAGKGDGKARKGDGKADKAGKAGKAKGKRATSPEVMWVKIGPVAKPIPLETTAGKRSMGEADVTDFVDSLDGQSDGRSDGKAAEKGAGKDRRKAADKDVVPRRGWLTSVLRGSLASR